MYWLSFFIVFRLYVDAAPLIKVSHPVIIGDVDHKPDIVSQTSIQNNTLKTEIKKKLPCNDNQQPGDECEDKEINKEENYKKIINLHEEKLSIVPRVKIRKKKRRFYERQLPTSSTTPLFWTDDPNSKKPEDSLICTESYCLTIKW